MYLLYNSKQRNLSLSCCCILLRCGTGRAAIIFMIYNNGNTYLHYRHPSSPRPRIFTIYSFFHCNTTAPGDGMRGWMEWGICSSDQRLFHITAPHKSVREAFKKKTIFFVTNVTLWGGVWSGSMSQKKTIVSKSFLCGD